MIPKTAVRFVDRIALLFVMAACLDPAICAEQQSVVVDLSAADASQQWHFGDERATVTDGVLRLDGEESPVHAFLKTPAYGDVTLSAKFKVEPHAGVQAVGFVIGSVDSLNFHYVHFDKNSAILCRSDIEADWREIARATAPHTANEWYSAQLKRSGSKLSVYFAGELLFEADVPEAKDGLVGFYASQTVGHVKDISVSGATTDLQAPWKTAQRRKDWIHVCTDGGAGQYEAFPDVCRLADGRLMCVFYASFGHVGLPKASHPKGGRISYCVSEDEGRSWSNARTLYDGPNDDRDPSIVQLSDGRLVCSLFILKPDPEKKKPFLSGGCMTVTSHDGGETWDDEPQLVTSGYYCSSPIRELPDGRLILGLYKQTPEVAAGAVVISSDGGKSWGKPIDIPNGSLRLEAETDVIQLKNGDLFAAQRGRSFSAWSVSSDGGNTWTVAKEFGFPGHCHYLHRAPGDILLMAHRLPATSLHYSLDEAKTWSDNVLIDDVIGAYPSMVTLKDDSILVVYYEEGKNSSIRSKRFRATRDGIEWLSLKTQSP